MSKDEKDRNRKVPTEGKAKVELGSMGGYGMTSNKNIAGNEGMGDLEDAVQPDKGLKLPANTPIHEEYDEH